MTHIAKLPLVKAPQAALRRLELFCCAHPSGVPLLQLGDEGNWDFEVVPPHRMTPIHRMRVEALIGSLSDVVALQQ